MLDLELMHNFTSCTYTTITSDLSLRQMLRTTVVRMALGREYLMRTILSVSALHIAHHRPQTRDLYVSRAMMHHQLASSVAIGLMSDLKPEECENLHLFSMLTIYFGK
jgi:hypothetical protein